MYAIGVNMKTLSIISGTYISKEYFDTLLNTNKDIEKIIFFTPFDPYPDCIWGYDAILSLSKHCAANNIMLSITGCSPLHYYDLRFAQLPCIKPWTTFFATTVTHYSVVNNIRPYGHTLPINKLFTSLNSKPRYNRCMFIDYMSYYNLIDTNYVSWNMTQLDVEEINRTEYQFKYWLPERLLLEESWAESTSTAHVNHRLQLTPPMQFKDSLFSLVSETVTDEIMITEKTWIPIYHQRPFLTMAAPGYHKFLQELGIELYDEVFDYSFDLDTSDVNRCVAVMQQMKALERANLLSLYKLLRPKVLRNYKRMLDIVKDGIGKPNLDNLFLENELVKYSYDNREQWPYYESWNLNSNFEFLKLYNLSKYE